MVLWRFDGEFYSFYVFIVVYSLFYCGIYHKMLKEGFRLVKKVLDW